MHSLVQLIVYAPTFCTKESKKQSYNKVLNLRVNSNFCTYQGNKQSYISSLLAGCLSLLLKIFDKIGQAGKVVRTKAIGTEHKTCFGRVLHFKLGSFIDV